MSDEACTVLRFPLERRALQIHQETLEQVDARLSDVLRPLALRVLPGGTNPDPGPRAA